MTDKFDLSDVLSLFLFFLLLVSFVVGIVVDGSMLFGIQNNASAGDPATTIPVAIGFLCGGLSYYLSSKSSA